MRRRALVLACAVGGCLSEPDPVGASASDSTGSTEGGSTTGATGSPTGDGTAGTDASVGTVGTVDSTGTAETGPSESSTGPAVGCGNGVPEPPELCLLPDPAWTRDVGAEIVDVALARLDGDPGDGGVVVQQESTATLRGWWWDGASPAGPTLSTPLDVPAVGHGVLAADFDGVAGDELLFATSTSVYRARYGEAALLFDGPCTPSHGSFFAAGQLDRDAGLEVAWSPSESPYVLAAALDVGGDFCSLALDDFELPGKPGPIAIGRWGEDALADVAVSFGGAIGIGSTASPFDFGPLMNVPAPANVSRMAVADLEGNGMLDDLVLATPGGLVTLVFAGGPPVQSGPLPAGTIADIAVGDLDGDGDDDVAVADASAPDVLLALGDGTGVLDPAAGPIAPEPTAAIAIGDLDGDGAADLVLGGTDGRLRAYLADP